jgi:hypothetical protein
MINVRRKTEFILKCNYSNTYKTVEQNSCIYSLQLDNSIGFYDFDTDPLHSHLPTSLPHFQSFTPCTPAVSDELTHDWH